MRNWFDLWLRVLVGSTGVFGGLVVLGLAFWALETSGLYGLAAFTGFLTWTILAGIGLGVLVDRFAERVTKDLVFRRDFIIWFATRRRVARGDAQSNGDRS